MLKLNSQYTGDKRMVVHTSDGAGDMMFSIQRQSGLAEGDDHNEGEGFKEDAFIWLRTEELIELRNWIDYQVGNAPTPTPRPVPEGEKQDWMRELDKI